MDELLNELTQRVAISALEVTTIVSEPDPPSAKVLGCGVLLRVNDDIYLITAGHLLNLKDWHKLMIPAAPPDPTMVWLRGTVYTTYDTQSNGNLIDFALLKFAKSQRKYFKGPFCNPTDILVNHDVDPKGYYVIAGYPVSGVKKKSGKAEYHSTPVKFLTYPIAENRYEKHGFNPEYFILLNYSRKLAPFGTDKKQITKELTGISGSGLWYVPNWNDRKKGVPRFYLVGIMVENHKDRGFLAALRIDFASEVIRQFFIKSPFNPTKYSVAKDLGDLFAARFPDDENEH